MRSGLSAGRVQSVAVKLLVEREREIRAFVPEESWKVQAKTTGDTPMTLELVKLGGKSIKFKSELDAAQFFQKHEIVGSTGKKTADKK